MFLEKSYLVRMNVTVSVIKCTERNGFLIEDVINKKALPLADAKDFMGNEVVKAGFSYSTKWVASSYSDTSLILITHRLNSTSEDEIWVKVRVSWESGSANMSEVSAALVS